MANFKLSTFALVFCLSIVSVQAAGECRSSTDCSGGMCCSQWGYCGYGPEYCTGGGSGPSPGNPVPFYQERSGHFTYYNDAGLGACGSWLNAAYEDLVAVSWEWYSVPGNPYADPICKPGVCVKVSYNGKSITVPVRDKCPSCDRDHLDLSQSAFAKLAPLSQGHVYGAKWMFVNC